LVVSPEISGMARLTEGPWFRAAKNTWYATLGGKNVSLGVRGEASRTEAVKAWHRLMSGAVLHQTETRAPIQHGPTLQEVVDAFLADAESRLKPNTVRIYRYDLNTLTASHPSLGAAELTSSQIGAWLQRRKLGSTTKAMTLRSISACLGWAERVGLLTSNVATRVPKPRSRSRSADAVITEDGHERLLQAASPEFGLVLQVLRGTGCRPSEACQISTDTLDIENGVVMLTEHKADRTGKPRLIFLSPELIALLQQQVERYGSGPLLRSNKGRPWTGRSITQAMRRLRTKTGVKGIAYGYRHGFATRALGRGVPDAQVAALLGHTSTVTLHRHYSHLTSQAQTLRDALRRVQ
jgi:integrase/recombinase XerC